MVLKAQPDPDRLAVISDCMENYELGEEDAEWSNNIISRRAVVYGDGTIARHGEAVSLAIDDAELALCRRLSREAAGLMDGVSVGMGSESDDRFRDFFIAAPVGAALPAAIDGALIRARFAETLFPPVTITAEPFAEDTVWWGEVAHDGAESEPAYFTPWRAMADWFRQQPEFVATAFVRIGDWRDLSRLPETSWPEGTVIAGACLPRLALGLTRKGSLAGLFGHAVHS